MEEAIRRYNRKLQNLNQQLRPAPELNRERNSRSKKSSMDVDMVAGTKNTSAKERNSPVTEGRYARAMISTRFIYETEAKVQGVLYL